MQRILSRQNYWNPSESKQVKTQTIIYNYHNYSCQYVHIYIHIVFSSFKLTFLKFSQAVFISFPFYLAFRILAVMLFSTGCVIFLCSSYMIWFFPMKLGIKYIYIYFYIFICTCKFKLVIALILYGHSILYQLSFRQCRNWG